MKLLRLIVVISILLLSPRISRGDPPEDLKKLWADGKYEEVLPLLGEYREAPGGKTMQIDYMIATCLCRLPGRAADAANYFDWVLKKYVLDEPTRQRIESDAAACAGQLGIGSLLVLPRPAVNGQIVPGVAGKGFYYPDPGGKFFVRPTRVNRVIDPALLRQRMKDLSATTTPAALTQLTQAIVKKAAPAFAGPHFVVVAYAGQPQSMLVDVSNKLEAALTFFDRRYGLSAPDSRITVYLASSREDIAELANKIHGLTLAPDTIGYSLTNDQSIAAMAAGGFTSTLYHELTHLLLRRQLGDAPPWLDEGLAALYETVEEGKDPVQGGRTLRGVDNWRYDVLHTSPGLIPSFEKLIHMDWRAFQNADENYEGSRQTVNAATARYLMLFLQDRRLPDVVRAMIAQHRPAGPDDGAIIASTRGSNESIESFGHEFDQWLRKELRLRSEAEAKETEGQRQDYLPMDHLPRVDANGSNAPPQVQQR